MSQSFRNFFVGLTCTIISVLGAMNNIFHMFTNLTDWNME